MNLAIDLNPIREAPAQVLGWQQDEDGFLVEPGNWNPELAAIIASQEGIDQLSHDHWRVIHTIREYHARFEAVPLMRRICRHNRMERAQIKRLFSSCRSAWRIAGLPHPGEEAKTYMG